MARVNVEESAFGDARLIRLARKMGWSIPQALGHLVMLWHESQAMFAGRGTHDEIAAWGWCDDDAATASKWVGALASIGYIKEASEPDRWLIRGNEQQLDGLVIAAERAKKGGEANRRKWAERRDAESLKLSPSKLTAIPGVAQCKAMQGNARQEREANKPAAEPSPPIGDSPSLDLIKIWNDNRGTLAEARSTKQQVAKANTRARENPDAAYWTEVVRRLSASTFANSNSWATFRWLVKNAENHAKVSEGAYDDAKPNRVAPKKLALSSASDMMQIDDPAEIKRIAEGIER